MCLHIVLASRNTVENKQQNNMQIQLTQINNGWIVAHPSNIMVTGPDGKEIAQPIAMAFPNMEQVAAYLQETFQQRSGPRIVND
jgi:hypothetical protein